MCRKIGRPAGQVTLVPDPLYGTRPQRIQWQDRRGSIHQVAAVAVQDQWSEAGTWWESSSGSCEKRFWRLLLKPDGMITLCEDLGRRPGEPGYWTVDRIED